MAEGRGRGAAPAWTRRRRDRARPGRGRAPRAARSAARGDRPGVAGRPGVRGHARPARPSRPARCAAGCCSTASSRSARRRRGAGAEGTPLVEGDVPDRRGLLLHAVLPARHRRAGRRRALPAGHPADRGADPARHAADVPAGGPGEPARAGLGGHAGDGCCRSGGARSSSWSCSASSPPRGSSRSPCRPPTPPCTCWRTRYAAGGFLHGTGRVWSPSCCCSSSAGCSCSASARRSASPSRWSRSSCVLNAVVVVVGLVEVVHRPGRAGPAGPTR